jgi:hypothetical protein
MKKLGMMLACFALIGFFGCAPETTTKSTGTTATEKKSDTKTETKSDTKAPDTKPADKK